MKKILSIIIAAATLLSVCIFTAIPTAAADGEWNVYTSSSYYYDDYEGEPQPIPGYEYTKDGFHTLAPDWTDRTPVIHVQTNEKINIKDGVYMEVRVDAFSYEASDSWFNFNLWNQLHLSPGSINPKYGTGLQTLIRMHRADSAEETSNLRAVYWHGEEFKGFGGVDIEEEYASPRDDGKIYLTLRLNGARRTDIL